MNCQNRRLKGAGIRRGLRATCEASVVSWLTVPGLALFETVAPSSLAIDETPDPDEVTSWVDSTGTYTGTAVSATQRPYYPATTVNGIATVGHGTPGDAAGLLDLSPYPSILEPGNPHFFLFAAAYGYGNGGDARFVCGFDGATPLMQYRVNSTGNITMFRDSGINSPSSIGTIGEDVFGRFSIYYDGAGNTIYRVEGSAEEAPATTTDGAYTLDNVRLFGRTDATNSIAGYTAAVAIGGTTMTSGQRAQAWDDFGARFGL